MASVAKCACGFPRTGVHRMRIVRGNRMRWALVLNDAQAAFRRSPQKYSLTSAHLPANVGLRFRGPSVDPCSYFVFRKAGGGVGAFTTHIDDSVECGEQDVLAKISVFLDYRLGPTKVQESLFVHVGTRVSKETKS